MKKISLFRILKLLILGAIVLMIFTIKKNNSNDSNSQKSSLGQKFMSSAQADISVGCEGACGGYLCEGGGGCEGGD